MSDPLVLDPATIGLRRVEDGEPCGIHPHCLRHIISPCEGCGRKGGHGFTYVPAEDSAVASADVVMTFRTLIGRWVLGDNPKELGRGLRYRSADEFRDVDAFLRAHFTGRPHTQTACDGKHDQTCMICDGGLFICAVCRLAEGSLTTQCCGRWVPALLEEAIYAGSFDFRDGAWVVGDGEMPGRSHHIQINEEPTT